MADESTARVAENIRVELARRGLRQKQLAEAIGMDEGVLSRRLRGDGVAFRVTELERAAKYLGVPVTSLLNSERAAS
jgi:transcriptional regulator with XRE-family HTH domain